MDNVIKIKPKCYFACPLGVDIPGFTSSISRGDFSDAIATIREQNPFPGIIGRICPAYCEDACIREQTDEPVAIRQLERFCADYELQHFGFPQWKLTKDTPKNKSIAVIGSGPAGLTCSYYLLKKGYDVDIYEKSYRPGGTLSIIIPRFELPQEILFGEIQILTKLGGKFIPNCTVGKNIRLTELNRKYDALFIAIGAGKSDELHIPGKNLDGVFKAFDFLESFSRNNLDIKIGASTKALVFGGDNETLTSARILRRLGAEVHLFLPDEMQYFDETKIQMARQENIIVKQSIIPTAIFGEKNRVFSVRCLKVERSSENGKTKIVPIENSDFDEDCDIAIFSVRRYPDIDSLGESIKNFNISRSNTFIVDENMQTNIYGVFAGGEAVNGVFDPTLSMAEGKRAASAIDKFLAGNITVRDGQKEIPKKFEKIVIERNNIAEVPRNRTKILAPDQRDSNFREVEISFDEKIAIAEAERCIFDRFHTEK